MTPQSATCHGYRFPAAMILRAVWLCHFFNLGSCFTPRFARTCAKLGAKYCHARQRSPQTIGVVERFKDRVSSEVLGITISSHVQLKQLLRGFNAACNTGRQRVLNGKTIDQLVAERLKARRKTTGPQPEGRAGPAALIKAHPIVDAAKGVSQPGEASSGRRAMPIRICLLVGTGFGLPPPGAAGPVT
ncbi:hypothetical protein [Falsiroseomonas sp. E2-1-a20]|uniref:hypothetical protein n=1 Tax=Falsiroseomonas sp. E2-1-a20 TaxID=3239300 RepID=UPI003F415C59